MLFELATIAGLAFIAFKKPKPADPATDPADPAEPKLPGKLPAKPAKPTTPKTPTKPTTPAGPPDSLTETEKTAARMAAAAMPASFPEAPTADLRSRGSRTWPNWLANWVYWSLYVVPGSSWVKAGNAPGPWKFVGGDPSPFVPVWTRIRDFIGTLELSAPKRVGRTTTTPKPAPTPTPTPAPADDAAKVGLTTQEKRTADLVIAGGVKMFSEVDQSIVPPPTNKRASQPEDVWVTNVIYWSVYRSPDGEWIKGGSPAGPVLTPKGSPWADAWNRIRKYVAAELARTKPTPTPTPTADDAAKVGLTTQEKRTADLVILGGLKMFSKVDPSIVPPPKNERAGQDEDVWLTNVIYWSVYRSPEGEWIKAGNAAGPVTTPKGSTWAARWLVIRKYVQTELAK